MHTSIHHSVIHYEHTTSRKGSKTSDQFMLLVWGGGGGGEAGGGEVEGRKEKKSLSQAIGTELGGVLWV